MSGRKLDGWYFLDFKFLLGWRQKFWNERYILEYRAMWCNTDHSWSFKKWEFLFASLVLFSSLTKKFSRKIFMLSISELGTVSVLSLT